MKRRDFFKYSIGGILGGLVALLWPEKVKTEATKYNPVLSAEWWVENSGDWQHTTVTVSGNNRWRFYINGKEVDSSRVVDENGVLHWPFQGSKQGDICIAKSPKLNWLKEINNA